MIPGMGPESFPDPRRTALRASMFAADLVRAADDVFAALGQRATLTTAGVLALEAVTLPITVPVDEDGVVVLSTGHVDAPRCPASLVVARPVAAAGRHGYRAAYELERAQGGQLLLPGVRGGGAGAGLAVLARLTVAVADRGLAVVGLDGSGDTVALDFDDTTAGLVATALLITVGVKLAKAARDLL